jgi:Ca2+-transporting ATPase
MIICGLVGLFMAIANLVLIEIGKHAYDSTALGSSIGLSAFVLMLVVAGYESRSETESVFRRDTFDSSKMNLVAVAEILGGILLTQWDFLRRLLGTEQLTAQQWGLSLAAAVLLLLTWELGKWIARRGAVEPVEAPAAEASTAAASPA